MPDVKFYNIKVIHPPITKTEREANSNKRKTFISARCRKKLVHGFYISKKCS